MTEPFETPAWLGRTPYNSFTEYGDTFAGGIWYGRVEFKPTGCLYDIHMDALKGDERALFAMRQYYLALITSRLKS